MEARTVAIRESRAAYVTGADSVLCTTCGKPIVSNNEHHARMIRRTDNPKCSDCVRATLEQANVYYAMSYAEYLKTDHWQELRVVILERDGYRCRLCNSAEKLCVHHRKYERGNERLIDLSTLCTPCHDRHHKIGELEY